ncbi:sensor histidine kinase [Microlunatus ginsengisoli]|uniref:histidine kinase n=1 Tax=Microlunatus ginsengisoli TaxID=363863 RepID=A0ABP6ZP65_9ACTN
MGPIGSRVLVAAGTVVVVADAAFDLAVGRRLEATLPLLGLVAIGVAWSIHRAQPTSPVAPALAWCSAGVALNEITDGLAYSASLTSPLPLAHVLRPIAVGLWPLSLVGVFALLMVFPDGRRRGWLWAAAPFAYAAATGILIFALWGARNDEGRVIAVQSPVQLAANVAGIAVIAACLAIGIASVIGAYRSGAERRRRQIRWLVLAGTTTGFLLIAGWIGGAVGLPVAAVYAPVLLSVVVLLPLSVGIAVLRHDLFDVDRLLSESASWAVTLLVSAAAFAAVVFLVSRSLGPAIGIAPVAAAFVVSLLLLPMHRYLTALISRLVDRDRTAAVGAVQRFTADVRAGRCQPEEIQSVLRAAQRDDELRVLVAAAGGWTDLAGQSVPDAPGFAIETDGIIVAKIALGWDSARSRRRIADLARHAWLPIEISRLRLGLRDALREAEASRTRLAEGSARERQRLERDLHDGAQQRIIATGIRLRLLQARLDPAPAAEVAAAIEELEGTVAELRRIAHGVRPSRLDDGLGPALASLRDATPLPLDLHVDALPELEPTRALAVYLLVSEAVTNALKHARASAIEVDVSSAADALAVRIRDDGIGGIPVDGLVSLRDRIAAVGGRLDFTSPAGGGTEIVAVL